MAIVFVSPKKKQKIFFTITALIMTLFLVGVSLIALLPEFKEGLAIIPINIETGYITVPEVKINFNVVDSDSVRKLEPFVILEPEFSYVAQDSTGKQLTGMLLASSQNQAETILKGMGLTIIEIREVNAGKQEPFIPYY